jgi:class 3 adenylate cyclase/tetratricopeptide (TPR) repeat protein
VPDALTICPACRAQAPVDARFCPACGATLVERVSVEERRTVTALFADLVGSTHLGERLDPEIMRGLVGRFFELVAHETQARGGSVETFSGDAVLAIFGRTVAHEDDPERAVRAAIAIQAALVPLALDADRRHGVALSARIGVEAGEVVVGDPFGGATMATGDPLNLAARLEQQAAPGEIIIGPAVRSATSSIVEAEPLEPRQLAGKAERVAAWRVVGVTGGIGEGRGVKGLSAPLTGRDEEVALLLDDARRTRASLQTVLVTIVAAPGVGKSRLVREFAKRLVDESADTLVFRGRCLPYGEGITYWPVAEILRQVAEITPEMTTAEVLERIAAISQDERVAHRLAFAIGLRSDPPGGGAGVDREIAWAFRRLFEITAVDRPLLFVFEDIHWAEPALLDLLEYLGMWIRDLAVLVVCLARPELFDRRPTWGGGRVEAHRMNLEPLSREESATLVGELLAIDALPVQVREVILDRAEGNPLFVEEVVRMLIDEGRVVREGDRWVARAGDSEMRVPESIEALIRARLDTLPRAERAVLQGASVVGRVFQRSAVASLSDGDDPIQPHLDDAVMRDLISEERGLDMDPTFRFKHILVRDVAYASLPKARRAELHARVAEWLSRWAGDRRDEFVEIEAYHLEQAVLLQLELTGQAEPVAHEAAVAALSRSAELALQREDNRAAESFADRCLALKPTPPMRRLEIEWLWLESLHHQGDLLRGREVGDRLAGEAAAIGRPDLEGRALLVKSNSVWIGLGVAEGVEPARAVLERALGLLREAGDVRYEFETTMLLGYVGWWYGELEAAWTRWNEGVDLARRMGDPASEAEADVRLASVRGSQGRHQEQAELLRTANDLADRGSSRRVRALVDRAYGDFLCSVVSLDEGSRLLERALPVLDEIGDREGYESALSALAYAEDLRGDPAAARALCEAALAVAREMGHRGSIPEEERRLAEVLLELGEVEGAEVHALQGAETVSADDWFSVASTRKVLGQVRDAQGRDDEAIALLRDATDVIEGTDYVAQRWEWYLALGEYFLRRGAADSAEPWLEKARAIALLHSSTSPILDHIERRAASARERLP